MGCSVQSSCGSHQNNFQKKMKELSTNEELFYGNKVVNGKHTPKCDIHQRHIPKKSKNEAISLLGPTTLWTPPSFVNSFEDLYDEIRKLIGGVKGVGNLTIYDVAARIGAINDIWPEDYVYLHASPMVSAKHLNKIRRIALPKSCSLRVPVSVFSSFYPSKSAFDIEVELCISKDEILKMK